MTQFLHAGQTNTDKERLAFHGGTKVPGALGPPAVLSQADGLLGRHLEAWDWTQVVAHVLPSPGSLVFPIVAGLPYFTGLAVPAGRGGEAPSCPPPHTKVNSYLLGSSRLAEGGAVTMDTRAGPHWSSVLKAGPTGNHTHSDAPKAILGTSRKRLSLGLVEAEPSI